MEHDCLVAMPLEHRPGATLELRKFRKQITTKQVRRRCHVAVTNAYDGWHVLAIGIEYRSIFFGCDERLVGKREHRCGASPRCSTAVRNELPMPVSYCEFSACRIGSPSSAAITSLLASHDDEHIIEAGVADLAQVRRTSGSPPSIITSFGCPIRVEAPAARITALTIVVNVLYPSLRAYRTIVSSISAPAMPTRNVTSDARSQEVALIPATFDTSDPTQ